MHSLSKRVLADLDLSKLIEKTEAQANSNFIDARKKRQPELGADKLEVQGTIALFDGSQSPLTQSFGLGLFSKADSAVLDQIESFYARKNSVVYHEISPLADLDLIPMLVARGYHPHEFTNVLYQELSSGSIKQVARSNCVAREAARTEAETWARVSAEGWSTEGEGLFEMIFSLAQVSAHTRGTHLFLSEVNQEAVATGGLFIHDQTALLMGASTIAAARQQGAQSSLLSARLNFALEMGCSLAVMGAQPGSQSQKNAEKNGFRVAYTRIKWKKASAV